MSRHSTDQGIRSEKGPDGKRNTVFTGKGRAQLRIKAWESTPENVKNRQAEGIILYKPGSNKK